MPFVPVDQLKIADRGRIVIDGPEGSGKTLTCLKIARGIVGPKGRIAVIDTENGGSRKFRRYERFDVAILQGNYAPAQYVALIHEAEQAGYDALLIDSLSHAWAGQGGVLEQHDAATAKTKGDSFRAWAQVTPEHNRLVDALLGCKCHLLCTLRVRTEYVVETYTDSAGRTRNRVRKVGTKPVQRDGMLYEFDLAGDFDDDGTLTLAKSRCPELNGASFRLFQKTEQFDRAAFERGLAAAEQIGVMVARWLETGEGLTKAEFLVQTIRERAAEVGEDLEAVEALIEAAGDDIGALDDILAGLGQG
jgi:energy-coupling factor transporter ATP-binding protein EcfA2